MSFAKSLRVKVLLSALLPVALVLAVVAVVAFYTYERQAREVLERRDAELAQITAARLSEGLARQSLPLVHLAGDVDIQSFEPSRMGDALERLQSQLFVFDAGVVIYDGDGVAVWSDPFAFERRNEEFPIAAEFTKVLGSSQPYFSDVFLDARSGEYAILLGVPIVASGGELKGVIVGLLTVNSRLSNTTYTAALEISAGREGFAYLVDGQGRIVFHLNGDRLAAEVSSITPVTRVLRGEAGAVITEGPAGMTVISGYAPVPGTGWGVITEEMWSSVVGPIRRNSWALLGLLLAGGIVSGALVYVAIGRVLKPVKDLTQGAQRIAGGDFDYTIPARTGDEIQALAQQFNTMAGALNESYSDLERRVEVRTEELRESNQTLRTLIQASPVPILSLDRDSMVRMWNPAAEQVFGWTEDEVIGRLLPLIPAAGKPGHDVDLGQTMVSEALNGVEARRQKKDGSPVDVSIWTAPLRDAAGGVNGVMGVFTDLTERKRAEEQLRLSLEEKETLIEEVQQLYLQEQRRAEQFRVIGEVGRHITSILDVDTLLAQLARVIHEAFGYYHVGIGLVEGDEVVYRVGAGALWDESGVQFQPARLRVGHEGIAGHVAGTGEPALVRDVAKDAHYVAMRYSDTRSELTVPILAKGEVLGVLDVQSDRVDYFDESDMVVLQSIASQAGIAIDNARHFESEQRRGGQMRAINDVAVSISSVSALDELLPNVAGLVRETFGYHAVSTYLSDQASEYVALQSTIGHPEGVMKPGFKLKIGEQGLIGWVAATGETFLANDVSIEPRYYLEHGWRHIKAELVVPIKQGDTVLGVLDIESTEVNAFDEIDVETVETLANQLAVAIENAYLFKQTREIAVIEERNRMAREIHDTLAQGFTGIVLQLEAGEQALDESPADVEGHLAIAKKLARECLQEARRSVWNLLPQALEQMALDVALQEEIRRFESEGLESASFAIEGEKRELSAEVQAALLRICQQSLANIRQHASATQVSVVLVFENSTVHLKVQDNGVGFEPDAPRELADGRGFGMPGMNQRASLLRGSLLVTSQPGQGTSIEVTIPTT